MDDTPSGRKSGGAENSRERFGDDGAQHSKKNELQPHRSKCWKVPPERNAAFVAAMEDELEVYARPLDPLFPVVCMDESSVQLIGEVSKPIRAAPGHPQLLDDEYVRNGVASIFLEVEPLGGRRQVRIAQRRARVDWASLIKSMLDERYPDAEKAVMVMDNLNTHGAASPYEEFEPDQAQRAPRHKTAEDRHSDRERNPQGNGLLKKSGLYRQSNTND